MEKNPRTMWLENLQRQHRHPPTGSIRGGGVGSPGSPVTNLSKTASSNAAFLSTSQYLRQAAAGYPQNMAPSNQNGHSPTPTPRAPRKPKHLAHKDPETMYDEIQELKKTIHRLTEESSVGKAKARRLEEDVKSKDKQIEALLDPSKAEETRRTLGDRKSDSASVIGSLKQRVFKLEQSLKDKEAALTSMQRDAKTTSTHELRVQMETMYQEILRLRRVNQVIQASAVAREVPVVAPSTPPSSKMKALNNAVVRLHTENQDLGKASQSLKSDLEAMLQENASLKDELEAERRRPKSSADPEFDRLRDENDSLRSTIDRLRKRDVDPRDDADDDAEAKTAKSLAKALTKFKKRRESAAAPVAADNDEDDADEADRRKIPLVGDAMQCLDALDLRETELMEELRRTKAAAKRAKEDRASQRKKAAASAGKAEQAGRELEEAKAELEEAKAEMAEMRARGKETESRKGAKSPRNLRDRRPSDKSAASPSPSRGGASPLPSVSGKADPGEDTDKENRKRLEEEEERRELEEAKEEEERKKRRRKSRERRDREENRAAVVIQSRWKGHQARRDAVELDVALLDVQSALRAHVNRADGGDLTREETSLLLQSAARGHAARTERRPRPGLKSRSPTPRPVTPRATTPRGKRAEWRGAATVTPRGSAALARNQEKDADSTDDDADVCF